MKKCCICGGRYIGYGNNPAPIKDKGECCNNCNTLVILARLSTPPAPPAKKEANNDR